MEPCDTRIQSLMDDLEDSIDVYVYHPDTHEFISHISMSKSKYEEVVGKEPITTKKLKYTHCNNERNVFNKDLDDWEVLKDYRDFHYNKNGEKVKNTSNGDYNGFYLPLEGDTPNSSKRFMKTFGPLPKDSVLSLPNKESIIDQLYLKNELKYVKEVGILLKDDTIVKLCENYIHQNTMYAKVVRDSYNGEYVEITDYDFSDITYIKRSIIDIKLNTLTRLKMNDSSAKKVMPYLDIEDIDKLFEEIDKLSICYYYYKEWLDTCSENDDDSSYTALYKDYINELSPDYEKIKIELGI